jgi:TolB-like protein/Tfp pilus assembly protein PilF
MPLDPGVVLGRYEVLAPLGHGGMGEVYRARDRELGREVALKVIAAARAEDPLATARFRREAQAVAALSHPAIVAIHDFGEDRGVLFAVTELLQGETVRARLGRGPFDPEVAVRLAAAVAEGLESAHARGIVHRDLKPENLFLTSDAGVKILDFGLAHVERGDFTTQATLSQPGVVVGTIDYMSPEQVLAGAIDGRSDLFSLGSVLFEMLNGRRPFSRPTAGETLAALLASDPLADVPALPGGLTPILARALQKDPARRYQSAREFLQALAAVPTGTGTARPSAAARPAKKRASRKRGAPGSIAVLPLVTGSPNTDFLAHGITEGVIDTLARLPGVRVMARSTVFRYAGRVVDPLQVARELGVRAVVTGSFEARGKQIAVSVELVDASDGSRLWGGRFQKRESESFLLQELVAQGLREHLAGSRKRADGTSVRRHTDDADAYRSYLRGRYHWARRPLGLDEAIRHFERAISEDPTYALPYAGLADAYASLGGWEGGGDPRQAWPRAIAAARRALDLDPALGEAHASLGYAQLHFDRDFPAAEASFHRAIELAPGYAVAHHWLSHYWTAAGRPAESLESSRRALALDPLDRVINSHLIWHHHMAHEFGPAASVAEQALAMDADFMWHHFFLGWAHEARQQHQAAVVALERAVDLSNQSSVALGALGHALPAAGRTEDARAVLRVLEARARERYVAPYEIGLVHAALGDTSAAFDWLEKALDERSSWLVYVRQEPRLRTLVRDARLEAIVRQVGFPAPGR